MTDAALTGFSQMFGAIDAIIMPAVGDDITLTPPTGLAITPKCVLDAPGGKKGVGRVEWIDNIIAKVDISSVVVNVIESDAPGLGKNWTALYFGKTYDVSEVLPRGDGVLVVILNKPGNTTATANGWK